MPSEYKPSEYKPPEYKPPKKCLLTSISPGLIFGILQYLEITKVPAPEIYTIQWPKLDMFLWRSLHEIDSRKIEKYIYCLFQ